MPITKVVPPTHGWWRRAMVLGVFILLCALSWWYLHTRFSGRVVSGLASNPATTLSSVNGRTNLIFLGVGGEGHAGADLTDSIIVLSYNHETHTTSLIPIPRDIWVKSLAAKINTAYHYGNERRAGGGRDLMKSAVSEITGLSMQYAVVIDFAGFEKIIDSVGGVDIVVDTTFDDYKYPIPGKETAEPESDRYEHVSFQSGSTHMDGQTALKFARSRHAVGDEGTDFARSRRQEKVILAFKNKLLSSSTLLSPSKLQDLFSSVRSSLDTDVSDEEVGAFIRLFISYSKSVATPTTIDISNLFITPRNLTPYQGQWVLIPKTSLEDIYAYVAEKLNQ